MQFNLNPYVDVVEIEQHVSKCYPHPECTARHSWNYVKSGSEWDWNSLKELYIKEDKLI